MTARACRVIELREDGIPTYAGLLVVEEGTRLVFTMRPTPKVDFVRGRSRSARSQNPRRHTHRATAFLTPLSPRSLSGRIAPWTRASPSGVTRTNAWRVMTVAGR